MTPSSLTMPARYISATASMMPEPQMPVTPNACTDSAKPGSSDQASEPMTLKRTSSRLAVDAHALDGARGGALAATDLGAFERRAGRTRAGQQAVAIAEDDLCIGAHVDDERGFFEQVRLLGEHHGCCVGAHVARDAREARRRPLPH